MKIPDLPWTDEVKTAIDWVKGGLIPPDTGPGFSPEGQEHVKVILKELIHQTQGRLAARETTEQVVKDCGIDRQRYRDELNELKHTNEVKDGRITFLELQGMAHEVACGVPYRKEKRKGERRSSSPRRKHHPLPTTTLYGRRLTKADTGRRSRITCTGRRKQVGDRRSK